MDYNEDLLGKLTSGPTGGLKLDDVNNDGEVIEDNDVNEVDGEDGKNKDKNKEGKSKEVKALEDVDKHKTNLLNNIIGNKLKIEGKEEDEDNEEDTKDLDKNKENKDKSAIETLMEDYGYVGEDYEKAFEGIDLKDNSVDGIKKFNEKRDSLIADSVLENLFEAIPEVGSLFEHLQSGKSVKTWQQKQELIDYSKIELKEDNLDQQEAIVKADLESKGISTRRIGVLIDDLKDNKELFTEAKSILENNIKSTKAAIAAKEQQEVAQAQQRQLQNQKIQKEVGAIIDSGKINGVIIPENIRKEFKQTVLSGKRDEVYNKLTTEQSLFLDWIALQLNKGVSININGSKAKEPVKVVTKKTNPMKSDESSEEEDSSIYGGMELLRKARNN